MNELLSGITDFAKSENLFLQSDKVLVAVSGGVDSIVLAHLLYKLGGKLGIAHVNFQLRGKQADLDQELVKEIADQWQVPFHFRKFDTLEYASEAGISTQMAARDLRYQWFEELAATHGYHKIATAHHLNDVLETLLLNLTKGTGIAGLHGILSKRGSVIRPLLFAQKEHLLEYATKEGLRWREDQSNHSNYYQRNLIRNQVIPLLRKINPSLEQSAQNTVTIMRSVEKQYFSSIEQLKKDLFILNGNHVLIKKSELKKIDSPVLTDLFRDFGFNYNQCRSLLAIAFDHTGKRFYSNSHCLNIDRDHIIISPIIPKSKPVEIPDYHQGCLKIGMSQWVFTKHSCDQYAIRQEQWVGAFDLEKIPFPLTIRRWSSGDRFYPLGMQNQKKLSDFFIDAKIPLNIKEHVQVLVNGEDVVWVVGHRIDDRYKVTEKTKRVLEIKVVNSWEHPPPNTE